MALSEDLARIAALAGAHADHDEELAGVVAADPRVGVRVYLCAFTGEAGRRSWLTLDANGEPIVERAAVREAVSISALCELAAESADGGELGELRSRLLALRLSEDPPGIDQAEEAALELERAIGQNGVSPFAEAMQRAMPAVEALTADVERAHKRALRS